MRYGLMFGPSFLFLLLVPFLGLALWAVMDALIRPDGHWEQRTRTRSPGCSDSSPTRSYSSPWASWFPSSTSSGSGPG